MSRIDLVPAFVVGSGRRSTGSEHVRINVFVSAYVALDVIPDVIEGVPTPVRTKLACEACTDSPRLARSSGRNQQRLQLLDAAFEVREGSLALRICGAWKQDVRTSCRGSRKELDGHDVSPTLESSLGKIRVWEVGDHIGAEQQQRVELAVRCCLEDRACVPARLSRHLVTRVELRMNSHIQQALRTCMRRAHQQLCFARNSESGQRRNRFAVVPTRRRRTPTDHQRLAQVVTGRE
jgi:hypothetical protein